MAIFDKKTELSGSDVDTFKEYFLEQWLVAIAGDLAKQYDKEKSTSAKCEIAKVLSEIKVALN